MASGLTPSGWVVEPDVVDERDDLPRLTGAQITALNARIAAGSKDFPVGTSVIRIDDGMQLMVQGVGTSAVFAVIGLAPALLAADDGTTLLGFKRSAIASTVPVELYDWLNTMPIRDVEAGCVGDGVADDTLALNVLTAAGKAAGRKVVGRVGATYKITDTVHINCNADFGGSTFATTTALATIAVKTSGTVAGGLLRSLDVRYPKLTTSKADGTIPTAGSIGVQIEAARNCRFEFNSILGFEENLQLYSSDGTNGYISYNSLYFNEIFYGARINVHLKIESTGWVNQCTWFGGQFAQISADTAAFNTTNVKITKVDNVGNNPPNGHTFIGCSMEGAFTRTIQYSLPGAFASTYFSCNTWLNCRFEASTSMEFNALALYDMFVGCLSAQSATYVGSVYPNIVGSTRLYRHTTDVTAIPGTAGFRDALNIPIFQPGNSGTAAGFAVGFNNRINLAAVGSGDLYGFNPGNNTSLFGMWGLRISGGVPRLEMGAGTAAATSFISWNIDWKTAGHWNPNADVTYNLGSASLRWNNVYALNFNATGTLGYVTGGGGTITQATSKATGVTLNKACGQIVTAADALAAGATAFFTVTNSTVVATDVVVAQRGSGGTDGGYWVYIDKVSAGSFRVALQNASAGSLSEAVTINFAVIKAVTA